MRSKKSWLIAACAALILVASVVGTVAYLTNTTKAVTNTFVLGQLFDPNNDDDPTKPDDPTPNDGPFVLYEYGAADDDKDGVYQLGTDEVTGIEYKVLPGVSIPKKPFVRTDDKLELDAYVFVEVVDETADSLTVTVDTNNWTELTGVTPKTTGAKVYVLKANNGIVAAGSALAETTILKDNEIVVANAEITDPGSVSFYGYIIQAGGFTSASDAWTKGFAPSSN